MMLYCIAPCYRLCYIGYCIVFYCAVLYIALHYIVIHCMLYYILFYCAVFYFLSVSLLLIIVLHDKFYSILIFWYE